MVVVVDVETTVPPQDRMTVQSTVDKGVEQVLEDGKLGPHDASLIGRLTYTHDIIDITHQKAPF